MLIDRSQPAKDAPIYQRYAQLMTWADKVRTLGVRTNADQPDQAQRGARLRRRGHRPLPHRAHVLRRGQDRPDARDDPRRRAPTRGAPRSPSCCRCSAPTSTGIFRAMAGRPVTIRTLDPPLHEFLPHDAAGQQALADELGIPAERVRARVESLHEFNPMLGLRGCRLGIVYPEITEMQARAIFEAAARRAREGIAVHPEIMIPLVGHVKELALQAAVVRRVADEVMRATGAKFQYTVGTMIEVPRGALTADAHRRGRRVLLLRHQRPDPDDARRVARRRRPLPAAVRRPVRDLRARSVRVDRRGRRRRADAHRRRARPRRAHATSRSASAASTAATRARSASATASASTTSPARPTACRSPASRPPRPRSRRGRPGAARLGMGGHARVKGADQQFARGHGRAKARTYVRADRFESVGAALGRPVLGVAMSAAQICTDAVRSRHATQRNLLLTALGTAATFAGRSRR